MIANRGITFHESQEETGLKRGTVQVIAYNDCEMTKMCPQLMPYALTPQQDAGCHTEQPLTGTMGGACTAVSRQSTLLHQTEQ